MATSKNSKKGASKKSGSGSKKSGSASKRAGSPLVDELDGDEGVDVVRQDGGVREEMTATKENVQPDSEEDQDADEDPEPKASKSAPKGKLDKTHFNNLRKAIDVAEAATNADVEREARTDARSVKATLAAAPKTKWLIQLAPGERPGATESVTINGYRLSIKKGVLVEIPVPVAEILAAHYNVQSEIAAEKQSKLGDDALSE